MQWKGRNLISLYPINNDVIIKNRNSLVGDYGFGTKEELQNIFNKLNGKKYLIMGNHDLRVGRNYYLDLGFIDVYKKKYEIYNYVFTHRPIEIEKDKINVYGHIHNKPVDPKFDDKNHLCVSLDKMKFKPMLLMEIKDDKNIK